MFVFVCMCVWTDLIKAVFSAFLSPVFRRSLPSLYKPRPFLDISISNLFPTNFKNNNMIITVVDIYTLCELVHSHT